MPLRSSLARFRSSLALGAVLLLGAWGWVESAALPRTAYFGGRRLAEKWVRLEQFEREGPVEVLLVGASQFDQGIDARRFTEVAGQRAFNLGIAGTDTYFQSVLLRQILATGRRPRTVIWALFDTTLRSSDINRQYLGAPSLAFLDGLGGVRAFELAMHLPQFHRRRVLDWARELAGTQPEPVDAHGRAWLATEVHPLGQYPDESGERPERGSEGLEDLEEAFVPAPAPSPPEVGLPEARAHVEATLRLLQQAEVEVWLVFTPMMQFVLQRDSPHAWRLLTRSRQGHSEWIEALAREHGFELLDLHACAGISERSELFYDHTHLNGAGSLRLGELLGELHSGRRPIPEDWRGLPSRAHHLAILGHEPPAVPARIELGQRLRLSEHPELFPRAQRTELYASVVIPEAGDYRLVLAGGDDGAAAGGVYARVGAGLHRFWRPTGRRRNVVWSLPAGEQRIELLALEGALGWDELVLERAGERR